MRGWLDRIRPRKAALAVVVAGAVIAVTAAVVLVSPYDTAAHGAPLDLTKRVEQNFKPIPSFTPLVRDAKRAVVSVIVHLKVQRIGYKVGDGSQPFFFGLPFPVPFPFHVSPPPREVPTKVLGSGFFISPKGYIVTNDHVVKHARTVYVRLDDGQKLGARIVGTDPYTDLAVLKVTRRRPFPFLKLGNSRHVHPGQWVVAIGNPFGLAESATAGIVSALGRYIGDGEHDRFIQTDAPINKGNSGGPLLNEQGEVIGVDTAILSPSGGSDGIGFAIPSNTVNRITRELIRFGHVVHGFIGVEVQQVSPAMAQALDLKTSGGRAYGALVAMVAPKSPASHAGLKAGDVIIRVGNTLVTSVNDLSWIISEAKPGEKLPFTYIRNARTEHAPVIIGKMPKNMNSVFQNTSTSANTPPRKAALGLTLSRLNPYSRQKLGISSAISGVLVAAVTPHSPAEKAGIQPGDIILGVDSSVVMRVSQVENDIRKAKSSGTAAVALRIMHDNQIIFVAVPFPHGLKRSD